MASKNIIKFILKMAVAGLILAGIIYAIVQATTPNTSQNEIIDKSNEFKISEKYIQTYDASFVNYAEATSFANKTRIVMANKINDFLVEHYSYYLNLTLFQNYNTNASKQIIFNLMKSLSNQIDNTLKMSDLTKVDSLLNDERQRRLENYANEYFKQTKIFIELNEKLKEYVYKVNYGTNSTGIVYEVQLEMVRDYCKAVFNEEVYNKYNSTYYSNLLYDATPTSLSTVLEKFNNRQINNVNGDKETKFAEVYMDLSKNILQGFYKAVGEGGIGGKQEYINSLTDNNPILETTIKQSLEALLDYIKQENF